MSDYPEFDHLLSRYLDGSVSAAELAELEYAIGDGSQIRRALFRGGV